MDLSASWERFCEAVRREARWRSGHCNRQDADCLARIGDLLAKRAQSLREKTTTNNKLPRSLPDLGLLDPTGLPVAGVETARKVLDPDLPANVLIERAG